MNDEILRKYNWLWFAQGYINSANLILDHILASDKIPHTKSRELWLPPSGLKFVTIPIFYNIRHVLELIIKTTHTYNNKKFDFTHDKKKLLPAFIEMYGEENDVANRLVSIIEKYYSKEFYERVFGIEDLPEDPLNEFFRFPEDKKGVNHIDPSLISRIDKTSAQEVKEDVKELDSILTCLYGQYRKSFYDELESKEL